MNLGVQALIKARSPGDYYDPTQSEHPLPETAMPRDGGHRDEVALIRAIGVKVCIYCVDPTLL